MFRVRTLAAVAAGVLLLVPLAPSAAQASAAAAPGPITLQVMSAFGSGCPTGTTEAVPTADNQAFNLAYSAFRVYGGDYKSCRVIVRIAVPAGWTYAVYSVINRVTPDLASGSTARLQMNAWFTGYPWTASSDTSTNGPRTSLWTTMSTPDSLVYAPCNQSYDLSVNDTLRVTGATTSSAELIDTDVRVSTIFNLTWKQC
jgi:hypothetical protein